MPSRGSSRASRFLSRTAARVSHALERPAGQYPNPSNLPHRQGRNSAVWPSSASLDMLNRRARQTAAERNDNGNDNDDEGADELPPAFYHDYPAELLGMRNDTPRPQTHRPQTPRLRRVRGTIGQQLRDADQSSRAPLQLNGFLLRTEADGTPVVCVTSYGPLASPNASPESDDGSLYNQPGTPVSHDLPPPYDPSPYFTSTPELYDRPSYFLAGIQEDGTHVYQHGSVPPPPRYYDVVRPAQER
jgi:hypothetical protein